MNKALNFVTCAFFAGIVHCGSQQPLLNTAAQSEANVLKNICMENALQADEVLLADSLYASGILQMKNGRREPGLRDLDMAALYYKLAIIKHDLALKDDEMKKLEKSLKEAQDKLVSYKKIILELENMR
jgi:hypothetical protein